MKKTGTILTVLLLMITTTSCSNSSVSETSSTVIESTEETTVEQDIEDTLSYPVITTGQSLSYDNEGNVIDPEEGEAYYGQDADYDSAEFSFTDNGDGTVTDNNTGLMWQVIPIDESMSWEEAIEYCESLELAGYDDWRIPTAKELFSISDFETGWPFLDTEYFEFPEESVSSGPPGQDGGPQGGSSDSETSGSPQDGSAEDEEAAPPTVSEDSDEDSISKSQGQFWSANFYEVGTTHGGAATAFGVNHATGHIKGYPSDVSGQMGKYVRAVRGDEYGVNEFVDNGDGTVSDAATGLMWMETDAGFAMDWDDALEYAENFEYAGYDDWRLPDVKELQSIVDYTGSYPAIDPDYFDTTELEENVNYYFWSSTSAYFSPSSPGYGYGWYVAFGYAVGNDGEDSHGAGAVRFSPKYEESSYEGEGGDNILNSVRLVRYISD